MECPDCNRVFRSRNGYKQHVVGKLCQKKANTCENCGKHFNDKRNYIYHTEHDVCSKRKYKLPLKLKQKTDTDKQIIEQLKMENQRLKGQVEALVEHPQNINNTAINLIVPPAFLTLDSYEHLSHELPHLLHKALSLHPSDCISYLIKETNCNPTLPMFNSIKITNKKDDFVQISDGTKFIYAPRKKTIMDLIENKRHILQEYVDNNGNKCGEKLLKRYQTYVDLLDDEDKDTRKELELDIVCMLLNVSDLIGSDDWSKKLLNDLKINQNDDILV